MEANQIVLKNGSHPTPEAGLCLLEAVAHIAGEKHSDSPECVSPDIAAYGRKLNDAMPDDKTRTRLLGPLIPKLIGTRSTPEIEQKRAYLMADRAVRLFATMAFRAAKMEDWAARLEALTPIVDAETAKAGQEAAGAAAREAWQAAEATRAAWQAAEAARAAWQAAEAAGAARAAGAAATWAAEATWETAGAPVWEAAAQLLSDLCGIRE